MICEYPGLWTCRNGKGDVFVGLPRVEVSLGRIAVLEDEGTMTGGGAALVRRQ